PMVLVGCGKKAKEAARELPSSSPAPRKAGPLRILYPYGGTVLPRGIAAPSIMWEGTETGATVKITMASDRGRVSETIRTSREGHTFAEKSWQSLAHE